MTDPRLVPWLLPASLALLLAEAVPGGLADVPPAETEPEPPGDRPGTDAGAPGEPAVSGA